jgi:hypothetical protein
MLEEEATPFEIAGIHGGNCCRFPNPSFEPQRSSSTGAFIPLKAVEPDFRIPQRNY